MQKYIVIDNLKGFSGNDIYKGDILELRGNDDWLYKGDTKVCSINSINGKQCCRRIDERVLEIVKEQEISTDCKKEYSVLLEKYNKVVDELETYKKALLNIALKL